MNLTLHYAFFAYLAAISLVSFFATVIDKSKARKGKRRISEKTLILLAVFGGAVCEYATMKIIRHKTLHKKFMIGLPLIIMLQAAAVFALHCFQII